MSRLFVIIAMINISCIKSTLSEEELSKEFNKTAWEPQYIEKKIGERVIHFSSLINGHKVLTVFVHGSPGSWTAFLDYFKNDTLVKKTDIISVDRPGFGKSGRGWPEPSMKEQARLIHLALSDYQHQIKILVGHSLGGPVIARMAMDYPDEYQGLLFLAPSIDPEAEKKEWYRGVIRTQFGSWVTPRDFWTSNEEIIPLKEELQEMLPLWNAIQAKSIVIHGTKDMLVPVKNAEFASKMLHDSLVEVRYLKNVNHFIPWTHPEKVVGGLFDLIDQSSSE